MKKIFYSLLLIAAPFWVAAQPLPDWLFGEWEGIGYQSDTQTQWATWMSYFPKYGEPRIDYPDLKCSGHWTLESRDGNTLIFREVITKTEGRCTLDDHVRLRFESNGVLQVTYAHSWAPDDIIATLTLRRRVLP